MDLFPKNPNFFKPVTDAYDQFVGDVRYVVQWVLDDRCYYGFAFRRGDELARLNGPTVAGVVQVLRNMVEQ